MEVKEKIQIFVDGGNFYHLVLKKMGLRELDFSFEEFAKHIANGRNISSEGKRYYVGTVREQEGNERSKRAMSKQTAQFNILESTNWQIKTSKLRTRLENIKIDFHVVDYKAIQKKGISEINLIRYREKGIDVKIATDLIVGAIDKRYDTAVIVSSDADLIPAVDWIRKKTNKKIEYIGFSIPDPKNEKNNTKPTTALIENSDIQRILVVSDIKKFVKIEEQQKLI